MNDAILIPADDIKDPDLADGIYSAVGKHVYDEIQAFASVFAEWGGYPRLLRISKFIETENLSAEGGCSECGDDFYVRLKGYTLPVGGEGPFTAVSAPRRINTITFSLMFGLMNDETICLNVDNLWAVLTNYTLERNFFVGTVIPRLITEMEKLGAKIDISDPEKPLYYRINVRNVLNTTAAA